MDDLKKAVADNIRHYRKAAGLTQGELAAKLGVAPTTVTGWEAGHRMPHLDMVIAISEALGRLPGDLIGVFELSQTNRTFIKKLAAIRKQNGLSVSGMADSLGVPAACVADWERGVSYPGPVIILRICEKFSVTPNELYFDQTRSEQQLSEDERDLVMQYRELDVLDKQRIRDLTDHLR